MMLLHPNDPRKSKEPKEKVRRPNPPPPIKPATAEAKHLPNSVFWGVIAAVIILGVLIQYLRGAIAFSEETIFWSLAIVTLPISAVMLFRTKFWKSFKLRWHERRSQSAPAPASSTPDQTLGLRQQIADLRAQLKSATEEAGQLPSANRRINELEERLRRAEESAEQLRANAKRDKKKLDQQWSMIDSRVEAAIGKKLRELDSQLSALRASHAAELSALKDTADSDREQLIREHEAKLAELEQARLALIEAHERTVSDLRNEFLGEMELAQRAHIQAVEAALLGAQSSYAEEIAGVRAELETALQRSAETGSQLEAANASIAALRALSRKRGAVIVELHRKQKEQVVIERALIEATALVIFATDLDASLAKALPLGEYLDEVSVVRVLKILQEIIRGTTNNLPDRLLDAVGNRICELSAEVVSEVVKGGPLTTFYYSSADEPQQDTQ